jgi:DNA-binding transcriptional MerR regulator
MMTGQYYARSQVIKILDCDESLVRALEEEELIVAVTTTESDEPAFSEDQLERIRVVRNLMEDLDVNLSGCAVILEMRDNLLRMQYKMDRILAAISEEMKKHLDGR